MVDLTPRHELLPGENRLETLSRSTLRAVFPPRGLVFLLALGLVLRLAFLVLSGLDAPLTGDEVQYQQLAANLAAGRGFVQNNNPFFPGQVLYAWQAPLYPLSLAVLYFFFGVHTLIAKLFGVLLGLATVCVTYDLAGRVLARRESTLDPLSLEKKESRNVAFLAALIVAIYPGLLTNAHLLFSETLFTFLLVLAFDMLLLSASYFGRGGIKGVVLLVAAGAIWGAATLTRGIALYFVAPLALWFLVIYWPRRGRGRGRSLRRAAAAGGIFAAAMLVVITPWTLRNYTVFRQFVPLETKGGVNFWLGNSPYTPDDFIRNVWKVGVREPMLAPLPQDEIARDRAAYRLGLDYVMRAPLTFIARMPVKFADFWGFERNLVDVAEATRAGKGGGWNSIAKLGADLLSDAAYVILALLAIGGLVYSPDNRWKLLLGGFIVYFVSVHVVVFGDARFHFPLIPFLALYAAWFVLPRARTASRGRARLVSALACALILVAVWAHEIVAAVSILQGG